MVFTINIYISLFHPGYFAKSTYSILYIYVRFYLSTQPAAGGHINLPLISQRVQLSRQNIYNIVFLYINVPFNGHNIDSFILTLV